jgi:hypothetical protein
MTAAHKAIALAQRASSVSDPFNWRTAARDLRRASDYTLFGRMNDCFDSNRADLMRQRKQQTESHSTERLCYLEYQPAARSVGILFLTLRFRLLYNRASKRF